METQMTAGPLGDADNRFALGARRGFTPTTEPISDTAVTPFGLTLRTAPKRDNLAVVRTANGTIVMATQKVTSITSDGGGTDEDVSYDVADDD